MRPANGCNVVSHWPGACTKWSMPCICKTPWQVGVFFSQKPIEEVLASNRIMAALDVIYPLERATYVMEIKYLLSDLWTGFLNQLPTGCCGEFNGLATAPWILYPREDYHITRSNVEIFLPRRFNSLVLGRCGGDFISVFMKPIFRIGVMEYFLWNWWVPQNPVDNELTVVRVTVRCQCRSISISLGHKESNVEAFRPRSGDTPFNQYKAFQSRGLTYYAIKFGNVSSMIL